MPSKNLTAFLKSKMESLQENLVRNKEQLARMEGVLIHLYEYRHEIQTFLGRYEDRDDYSFLVKEIVYEQKLLEDCDVDNITSVESFCKCLKLRIDEDQQTLDQINRFTSLVK